MDAITLTEINEAIKKSLPAQVGDTLQKELAALAALRVEAASLKERLASSVATNQELVATVTSLNTRFEITRAREADLTKREDTVLNVEHRLALMNLELRLTNEQRKEIIGLVGTIFRSPITTRTLSGYVPVPTEGMTGNPTYGQASTPGMVSTGSVGLCETVTTA